MRRPLSATSSSFVRPLPVSRVVSGKEIMRKIFAQGFAGGAGLLFDESALRDVLLAIIRPSA